MNKWISAFRLQTLPLAFSCILTGAGVSFLNGFENWTTLSLAILTATFLQVLSNLANDYGDAISGVDNSDRLGPVRAVQSGNITANQMKVAVMVFAVLSLISGIALLIQTFSSISFGFLLFFLLGIGAIAAAIKYTVGKNAYGYSGLGDLSVLIFFGLVGVCGSSYLVANQFIEAAIIPAITIGAFAMGVLNLNNLRDIENDAKFGKNTVVVKFGKDWAINYHLMLLSVGWVAFVIYVLLDFKSGLMLLPFLSLPIFFANGKAVKNHQNPKELISKLKQLALGTFIFSLLFFVAALLV